jgi:hypothetical protein
MMNFSMAGCEDPVRSARPTMAAVMRDLYVGPVVGILLMGCWVGKNWRVSSSSENSEGSESSKYIKVCNSSVFDPENGKPS